MGSGSRILKGPCHRCVPLTLSVRIQKICLAALNMQQESRHHRPVFRYTTTQCLPCSSRKPHNICQSPGIGAAWTIIGQHLPNNRTESGEKTDPATVHHQGLAARLPADSTGYMKVSRTLTTRLYMSARTEEEPFRRQRTKAWDESAATAST